MALSVAVHDRRSLALPPRSSDEIRALTSAVYRRACEIHPELGQIHFRFRSRRPGRRRRRELVGEVYLTSKWPSRPELLVRVEARAVAYSQRLAWQGFSDLTSSRAEAGELAEREPLALAAPGPRLRPSLLAERLR